METTILDEQHIYDAKLKSNKKAFPYFNSRALRYSISFPTIQRRYQSLEKVTSLYYLKKQHLIDEEATHIKTMVLENKQNTHRLLGKQQNKDLSQIKALAKQAEQSLKIFHKQCRNHSWVLEKHKRNLSQPKYKATTLQQKSIKKYQLHFFSPLNEFFFKNGWGRLQNAIINSKQTLTSSLHAIKTCEEKDQIHYCKYFWRNIITTLKDVKKESEFDIFSKEFIQTNLLKYNEAFKASQTSLTYMLFDDCLISQEPEQIEQLQVQRLQRLGLLAESLGIRLENQSLLDIKRAVIGFRPLMGLYFDWEGQFLKLLALVRKIEGLEIYAPSESKFYKVEYYAGWKQILSFEEIKQRHPEDFQKYLENQQL